MKTTGSICEFTAERKAALRQAFRLEMAAAASINIDDIARKAVARECPRFYVSEERAATVISQILKGREPLKGMRATKRRMFDEIYRRVMALRAERPHVPLNTLVSEVIDSPAPEFYISPRRAKDLTH